MPASDRWREAAAALAPYRWRLVGAGLGVVFFGLLVLGAIAGAPGFAALVVTIPVLVFLIAAGNGLQHWLGIKHRAPQFAEPRRDDDPQGGPRPT